MKAVLWLVGEPGAGKTTVARALLEPNPKLIVKPKWTVGPSIVAAGHYTGAAFDGADTVPYNGVAAALDFWKEMLAGQALLTLFDGDRFSNSTVVSYFKNLPVPPLQLCVLVKLPEGVGASRRAARAQAAGAALQNETWVKGRITKAQRFFASFPEDSRLELSGGETALALAQRVRAFVLR